MPKKGKHGKPMTKTRYIPKLFLRGDSVIYVLKNPNWLLSYAIHLYFLQGYLKSSWSIKLYELYVNENLLRLNINHSLSLLVLVY